MGRADSYGDLARLEQLLDEYATVNALDPAKLPTLRAQIWELVRTAELHHDLAVDAQPGAAEFDDFVLHIDGYLCEVKDALIRDGLHVLGQPPAGAQLESTVLAVLRAAQMWGGRAALPGLRAVLGRFFGLDEAALLAAPGQAGSGACLAGRGGRTSGWPARTGADAVDLLEEVGRAAGRRAGRGWLGAGQGGRGRG